MTPRGISDIVCSLTYLSGLETGPQMQALSMEVCLYWITEHLRGIHLILFLKLISYEQIYI